jgi:sulfur carrier protein ThiS
VASALLQSYVAPALAPAAETSYAVRTKDNSWHVVKEFRWEDDRVVAVVEGDITPASEWAGLVSLSSLKESATGASG